MILAGWRFRRFGRRLGKIEDDEALMTYLRKHNNRARSYSERRECVTAAFVEMN